MTEEHQVKIRPKVTVRDIRDISDSYDKAHGLSYPLPAGQRVAHVSERLIWGHDTGKVSTEEYDELRRLWSSTC